jgi:hypothetical protein
MHPSENKFGAAGETCTHKHLGLGQVGLLIPFTAARLQKWCVGRASNPQTLGSRPNRYASSLHLRMVHEERFELPASPWGILIYSQVRPSVSASHAENGGRGEISTRNATSRWASQLSGLVGFTFPHSSMAVSIRFGRMIPFGMAV